MAHHLALISQLKGEQKSMCNVVMSVGNRSLVLGMQRNRKTCERSEGKLNLDEHRRRHSHDGWASSSGAWE